MSVGKRVAWGVLVLSLAFVLFLIWSGPAFAQATASITGRVEDASGGAVPDAAVTVTNEETGNTRTATSDDSGNFRVPSLPVGHYSVKAEKSGFKTLSRQGVTLAVGQEAVTNLSMEVGGVAQEVTVTAEAQLVNTTTASIAGLVDEKQVKELPLNGRSFDNLITLDAGAIAVKGTTGGPGNGTQQGNLFSISGRRFDENLFLLNGVEYVGPSQFHSVPGGASGQMLGIDAVREFNVVSDTYGAEYGKRAGAQVSIVTQSGTNRIHGTLFEFLRNSVLDARNFFDQGSIPPFKRNNFGGALGAPIKKDKTFVFGNYEGFRQRLGLSILMVVPDNNARQGLLPCVTSGTAGPACATGVAAGTPTQVSGLNQQMLPFMQFWPLGNGQNLGSGAQYSFSNPLQSLREDFGTTRVDHTFSDKDTLASVYTISDGEDHSPQNPIFGRFVNLRMQVISFQETHLFSPTLINTFTVGFGRSGFHFITPPLDSSFPASLSFVTGSMPGRLTLGGGGTGGGSSTFTRTGSALTNPFNTFRNQFSYQDQVQWVRGKHQFSFGGWMGRLRSNEFGVTRATGEAVFASITTFLQGTVQTFRVATSTAAMSWRQWEGAWYVQDNYQITPKLTVRLGLRHEFDDGWHSANGRATYFDSDANGVLITPPVVGDSAYKTNNQLKMFSPRVGIAWDPFGKGKTSIRAGFGIYYDMLDTLGFNLNSNPPFGGVAQFSNAPFFSLVPVNRSNPFPPACVPGNAPAGCILFSPAGVDPTAKTPSVNSWSFSIEQEITPSNSLRIAYVGSEGFHQEINADFNSIHEQTCSTPAGCLAGGVNAASSQSTVPQGTVYIPVGKRPNTFISNASQLAMYGQSSYNALMVEFLQRYKAGLQFRANYTWSKTLDTASGNNASDALNNANGILDSYNPRLDWGLGATDLRNKFTFSGGYEVPFGPNKHWLNASQGAVSKVVGGWQINWILSVTSGFPFSVLTGSNTSGNGFTNNPDRPSWAPGFTSVPTSGTTGPANPAIPATTAVPQGFACAGVPANTPVGTPNLWYNPCAFSLPAFGTYGNTPRGAGIGPNFRELDLSIFKNTKLREGITLQFRAEGFNILNRANFGIPNITPFSGTSISPSVGVITNTNGTSRQIQFGLKLMF